MTRPFGSERGAALALVLFALVVIGGLVAAVFPLATLEQRAGGNARYHVEADQAAEAGPIAVLTGWAGYRFDTLPVNGTASIGPVALGGRPLVRWTATVVRLNEQLVLVRSVGARLDAAGSELARRGVAQVLRLDPGLDSVGAGSAGAIFARRSAPTGLSAARARRAGSSSESLTAAAGPGVEPLRYRSWGRVY
jgi:hypothetical protein